MCGIRLTFHDGFGTIECSFYTSSVMVTVGFSPFGKSLHEFSPDELIVLKDVSEGWFVDYKLQWVSANGYARPLRGHFVSHILARRWL